MNWYDLYRKVYADSILASSEERVGKTVIAGEERTYKKGFTQAEYLKWHPLVKESVNAPILGDYVSDYLNREDVREALHIPSSVQTWTECSDTVEYHIEPQASQWVYGFLRNVYRILFYSGDTDGAVPTYGTKRWIEELGWEITETWRPWYT